MKIHLEHTAFCQMEMEQSVQEKSVCEIEQDYGFNIWMGRRDLSSYRELIKDGTMIQFSVVKEAVQNVKIHWYKSEI